MKLAMLSQKMKLKIVPFKRAVLCGSFKELQFVVEPNKVEKVIELTFRAFDGIEYGPR